MTKAHGTKKTTTKDSKTRAAAKTRKPSALMWDLLRPREIRLMLHTIARWRIEGDEAVAGEGAGQPLPEEAIAERLRDWVPEHVHKEAINPKGEFTARWVGERFKDAIKHGFVKLGKHSEDTLANRIRGFLPPPHPEIIVAPDHDQLLRYVWETVDDHLTEAARESQKEVIIGVSGGRTMLELAQRINKSKLPDLNWWNIPAEDKSRVKVCSLTSGGIPTDIAALSDAVAGTIGTALGISAKGLLGPAWFEDEKALEVFRRQAHVMNHETMVRQADIIVTSVGNLQDSNSLMAQLLREQHQEAFLMGLLNPADILYHCIDGLTGTRIDLPAPVKTGILSVISIEQFKAIKKRLVVASGREKGRRALPGVLRQQMPTHVLMDQTCAEGLVETLGQQAKH